MTRRNGNTPSYEGVLRIISSMYFTTQFFQIANLWGTHVQPMPLSHKQDRVGANGMCPKDYWGQAVYMEPCVHTLCR